MINSHKVTKHACTSSWLPLAHSKHHTYHQVTVMKNNKRNKGYKQLIYIYISHVNVTQTVPDISPLMPMHQDPLLVPYVGKTPTIWGKTPTPVYCPVTVMNFKLNYHLWQLKFYCNQYIYYIIYYCGLLKFNHTAERCLCDKYHFIQRSDHFWQTHSMSDTTIAHVNYHCVSDANQNIQSNTNDIHK